MEEAPPSRQPASWADIPVELVGLVLGRLPAHVDRVRFAAVCPQWRAAARQRNVPPPMPMLLLPDATVYSLPGSKPFHFPACTGYTDTCGTGNWLVFSGEDGCFLRDPFTNETVTVPPLSRTRFQRGVMSLMTKQSMRGLELVKESCRMCTRLCFVRLTSSQPYSTTGVSTYLGLQFASQGPPPGGPYL
ncbi:unnamed protein product [Urochloa humidicola]